MFQAKLNGWKRLAASLVLLPGLTAVGAEVLHLLGTAQAEERPAQVDPAQIEKAKNLMFEARAAFERGDYARAQDMAEKIKAMNVGQPFWDDSPDQLLADIKKKTGGKLPSRVVATKEDPRILLRKANEALEQGKLDAAQDLARQAEANGRNVSWGLFEDTPASVLKDIQKARSKRDRAEADRLLTQARWLYEKQAASEEIRAANLDKARSLALTSAQLHGPYGMFDLGDRPQSLIKDIDAARAKLKVAVRRPNPTKPKESDPFNTPENNKPLARQSDPFADPSPKPTGYNPNSDADGLNGGRVISKQAAPKAATGDRMVLPPDAPVPIEPGVAGSSPYNPATEVAMPVNPGPQGNPRKSQAVSLMKQAHAFEVDHKYVEARVCLVKAHEQHATFNVDEETPDMALQLLMSTAQRHITGLCNEAHQKMAKQTLPEVAAAELKLKEADAIAVGMGLDRMAIMHLQQMIVAGKGKIQAVGGINAIPSSGETPSVVMPDQTPPAPIGPLPGSQSAILPADPNVTMPGLPMIGTAGDHDMELLAQAHSELRAAAFETARKITLQVLANSTHRTEAEAFLRTIDAEELLIKRNTALRSYDHAVSAYDQRNYEQALSIFKLIDPALLSEQKRASMASYMNNAARASQKALGLVQAGAPAMNTDQTPLTERAGADNLIKQEEASRELRFQKLRSKGLEVEAAATVRFGKGETDAALADLNNFIAEVRSANLDPAKVALLVRPVESRIDRLKVLKHQQDFLTKEAKDIKAFRTNMSQESLQKEYKKEETAKLMKDFARLIEERKFEEANKVAMKAKEFDPDDPSVTAAMIMSKTLMRQKIWNDSRAENEETNFRVINNAMRIGTDVDSDDPMRFDKERFNLIKNRTNLNPGISSMRTMSERERQIESKLKSLNVSFNFKDTPLEQVIGYLHTYTGINFAIDEHALKTDGVDSRIPITQQLNEIPLSSALSVVLDKARLQYIIKKDVVYVTTSKGARGALQRRTIPVADLVVPVQNVGPSPLDFENVLERSLQDGRPRLNGSPTTPFTPLRGLNSGMGTPTGTPSLAGGGNRLVNNSTGSGGGQLQTEYKSPNGTIEETLIRLITNAVAPDTWESMGGPGRIEYFPLGMALVINQTPDVIEQVIQLLESLRQLQDLEVAIEVRMITLAESFYERIGMDFAMNLDTHNASTLVNLVNNNGLFSNLQNIKNSGGSNVIGLQAPGVPTPDLNLPITSTSFGPAVPPFGGFPNSPGADGGVSLGLAFLSQVQVQLFLEAAQGDRRTNVMQAPKLTMFNGQSAQLSVNDFQYFMTGITVTSVNGQLSFVPQNIPIPLGVFMNIQPVVSGDRRFVRLNIQQTMTNLASANVPLFPITTIVTPVFDGGAQGQPVPLTQYIQQPTLTRIFVQTTVVVPDGGTVLLGGLKTLSEGRNEFGPPVLSKIPYIDRLFRNVGYGRDVQSLMMMVTPRIIINREEQERQTGVTEQNFGDGQ